MSRPFAMRLRAATLPPAGLLTTARFADGFLAFEAADGFAAQQVAVAALSASVGGFDDNQLFLEWSHEGTAHSAEPVDADARETLLATAPPGALPGLRQARGRASRQNLKVRAVVGSIAALLLAVALVAFNLSTVEAWLAAQISLKTEQRLGLATVEELEDEGKLIEDGLAHKTVADLGARLTKGSRYQYRWFLRDDDEVNAFAIPGGNIVVHTGLIEELQSPEELAGVLAHEIQHVESRHVLQQMIHTAGLAAVLAVTLGDVSTMATVLMHSAGSARHSRKLEAEADGGGLQRLTEAGIPREGLASFFRRQMSEKQRCDKTKKDKPCEAAKTEAAKDTPPADRDKKRKRRRRDDDEMFSWLSSHPGNQERLATIEARIAALPCPACTPLDIDWAAVQKAVRERNAEKPEADAR